MTTDYYPHTDEVEGIEENILFESDTGTLPLDARKGLVLLLKRTHVWEGTNPREWNAIVGWQGQIESRLNDMLLTLRSITTDGSPTKSTPTRAATPSPPCCRTAPTHGRK
jgi:hypothetical protein